MAVATTGLDFTGTERFEIREHLGRGGFGRVYRALDRERGVEVALKVLEQREGEALYRFKREFRALADVVHPNLVSLYELLSVDDVWFFTMELVDGVPFLDHVRGAAAASLDASRSGGPTPTAIDGETTAVVDAHLTGPLRAQRPVPTGPVRCDALKLRDALRQLVVGLDALHGANQLHCDIKPRNVLVDRSGRVVLLDFGLVSELGATSQQGGEVLGTPAYMSPEQAAGGALSPASDWYAVGVMLFEALTGRRPFEGEARDVLALKQRTDPPSVGDVVELDSEWPRVLACACDALLRRDPATRPNGKDLLWRLRAGATAQAGAGVQTTVFVGRAAQLQQLDRAWHRADGEGPIVVCLRGPSGIGKSALAKQFIARLRDRSPRSLVLQGRCYEAESVPYQGLDSVVDELSQWLRGQPDEDVERMLIYPSALARMFPVLRQVRAIGRVDDASPSALDAHELRRQAFEGLRKVVAHVATRHRVAIFIDDAHRGDADTAALLAELVRPPQAAGVLVVLCSQTEGESALVRTVRTALRRDDGLVEIELSALPSDAAYELLERNGVARGRAAALIDESGGNPFLLTEFARHVAHADTQDDGWAFVELDDIVRLRVDRLPASARRLLELVAVAGHPITIDAAGMAADLGAATHDAMRLLRLGHLVRATGMRGTDRLEIYHDRIQSAVVSALDDHLRRRLHRELAWALEATNSADSEALAEHFRRAGIDDKAAQHTARAAEAATEALAFDRAARLYREAVRLEKRPGRADRLRVRWAEALANARRGGEAARVYAEAARAMTAGEALELRRRGAEQLLISGRIEAGLDALSEVMATVGLRMPGSPARAAAQLLWYRARLRLRGLAFTPRTDQEVGTAALTRVDTSFSISMGLGVVDPLMGACFQALNVLEALRTGEPFRIMRALAFEGAYTVANGERGWVRGQGLLALVRTLAQDTGDARGLAYYKMCRGAALHLGGCFAEALEAADEAEEALRLGVRGATWEIDSARFFALDALRWMGRWGEIGRRVPTLVDDALRRGDLYAEAVVRAKAMWVMLARDEPDNAEAELVRSIGQWDSPRCPMQRYWLSYGKAEVELYRGRPHAALGHVDHIWPLLRRQLLLQIPLLRVEAELLRARANLAVAAQAAGRARRRCLRTARGALRAVERTQFHVAWTAGFVELLRAGIATIDGDHAGAREHLREACREGRCVDTEFVTACALHRLGDAAGTNALRAQGVADPDRLTAMLVPGAWSG